MIVVLKQHCSEHDVEQIIAAIGSGTANERILHRGERLMLSTDASLTTDLYAMLSSNPAVEHIVPTAVGDARMKSPARPPATEVSIDKPPFSVGGREVAIIAGPCSVEDRQGLLDTAHAVKACGATGLRGGAFKPRTNPYSFQGLGERALEWLAEARESTGLAVVTEVLSPEHADVVARYADVLQIGTRNMHNFSLLSAVGRTGKPVLLKRGWSAQLNELLHAAEYIIQEGNPNVILCERGIRTFEQYTRNTLSLALVPAVKQASPLPIIVDPSQGTGVSEFVIPMSRAAIACGADGLLIEVHPQPQKAVTDGQQCLDLSQFETLMNELRPLVGAVHRSLA